MYKLYTPPYHPASNGRIEGFHAFLKACISKHIAPQLEWDDLVPLACTAYNFIPNEHSKKSPFFLMFGRDPVLPLNTLLEPKIRYLGNDINVLSLEAMKICSRSQQQTLNWCKTEGILRINHYQINYNQEIQY